MIRKSPFNSRGQSTAEYAILIGLVVAVAIAMQTYVKRGMQGRLHDASDKFYSDFTGDTNWDKITTTSASVLKSKQFEHEKLSSKSTQATLAGTMEDSTMAKGGQVTRKSISKTKQADLDFQKYDRY